MKRSEYDKLIYGMTDSNRFKNHDMYEYYKSNPVKEEEVKTSTTNKK
jgi:hypothetical protein